LPDSLPTHEQATHHATTPETQAIATGDPAAINGAARSVAQLAAFGPPADASAADRAAFSAAVDTRAAALLSASGDAVDSSDPQAAQTAAASAAEVLGAMTNVTDAAKAAALKICGARAQIISPWVFLGQGVLQSLGSLLLPSAWVGGLQVQQADNHQNRGRLLGCLCELTYPMCRWQEMLISQHFDLRGAPLLAHPPAVVESALLAGQAMPPSAVSAAASLIEAGGPVANLPAENWRTAAQVGAKAASYLVASSRAQAALQMQLVTHGGPALAGGACKGRNGALQLWSCFVAWLVMRPPHDSYLHCLSCCR
jgi:hypothetical protein